FYGAFMAGLKAAPFAPTWPDMNGVFMPDTMGIESWINNPFNVQFLHRMLAYLLSAFTIFWFIRTKNLGTARFRKNRHYPLILVFLQVVLGIFTVLYAPKMGSQRFGIYEIIAQAHQLVAMFLLVSLFVNLFLMSGPKASAARF
ncbi:MAG: heme A synthase, partial [Sphingobacteriales bacterium]